MFKVLKSIVWRPAIARVSPPDISVRYRQLPALYSTFHAREFQFETSDGESGTLIHRFSRHIAMTKRDFTDPAPYNFRYSSFYPVYSPDQFLQQLRDISCRDLGKLLCMTSDFRTKTDYRVFADVANALDEETESRVEGASFGELLALMHGYLYLLPNKITKLSTYRKAMPRLVELFGGNVNAKDFMTVLFFLGLWKKNPAGGRLVDQFLRDHLEEFLDGMDAMDFTILASASYKTSVRIQSDRFQKRLEEEICSFEGSDTALLVTLVKCARMNRFRSERVLEKLRTILANDAASLDFRGISHLFAYVAEILVKDDSLNALFTEECSKRLEAQILTDQPDPTSQSFRAKDLSTFLHCCATLSIPLDQLQLQPQDLLNEIFRRIEHEEYRFTPDTLVDTCLSLWLMNCPSVDLLSAIFSNRHATQSFKKDRPKIESRRDLLLACAEIEAPEAGKIISRLPRCNAFQLDRPAPEYLVRNRAGLGRVRQCLEEGAAAREKLQIYALECNLPVKYLNIAGLLVTTGAQQFNVEVLERGNCLSDERTPTGLLALKMRLLARMQVPCVVINSFEMKSDDDIVRAVEEGIQKFQQQGTKERSSKTG